MKSTRILRQAVTLVYVSLGLAQQNPGFYPKGISGLVTSIVSTHDGLYAVGNFDGGDGIYSPGAVLWDGTRWAPLGGGFSTSGYELQGCLLGGRLAITGSISSVDGKPCHGIAEWDGKSWDCPEISGRLPAATTLWRDSLLVATDSGAFKQAGGGWESYGRKYFRTPVSNRFGAEGGKLWMYGQFEMVGDSSFKNLAVWENGDWKKPFPIHPERVIDLIWFQDALYLIARIASASEDSIGIYRSNATILERLPVQYPHATLDKFVTDGKSLFVLGGHKKWFDPAFEPFVLIGRREGLQLGRLDAGAFSLMKEHVFNGLVTDAEFVQDKLVVAGRFSGIGGVRADNIATWDGTQWSPISTIAEPGPSYAAAAMRSDGKSLIVGGVFLDYAGNGRVGGVAKWDGIHWSGYLQGFTYSASAKYPENFPTPKITAIGVEGSDVYVGGEFDGSESGRVLNVAHWDGVNWKSLGDGYHGGVNDILVDGNEVYVAGPVSTRDSLSDIATMGQGPVSKWNGNSWTDLHLEVFGKVVRLAMFGGELYAAGVFSSQGNNNPGLAVRRNGSWGFIGAKAYEATDMVKVGQELYVLGPSLLRVNSAGTIDTIATHLGPGRLATDGKDLFVLAADTRDFPGIGKSDLARWDGTSWKSLGTDLFHDAGQLIPTSIAVHAGFIYVSGWVRSGGVENVWCYRRFDIGGGTWSNPRFVRVDPKSRRGWRFEDRGTPYFSQNGAPTSRIDIRGVSLGVSGQGR